MSSLTTLFFWIGNNLENFSMLLMIISAIGMIIYWHVDKSSRFDLRDLLIDSKTKELSVYKAGQLAALIASTYILLHETRAGRLTESLFGLYMVAWSGVNMVNKYLTQKEDKTKGE